MVRVTHKRRENKKAVFIKKAMRFKEKLSTIADCFSRLAAEALELELYLTYFAWLKWWGCWSFQSTVSQSSLVFTFRTLWLCFRGHWICVPHWHFMVMFPLVCCDKSSWIIWCSLHMFAHIAFETGTSVITSARQIKMLLKKYSLEGKTKHFFTFKRILKKATLST